jgi:GntR family transcriptional regulator
MQENLVLEEVDGEAVMQPVARQGSAAERAILGLRRRLADGTLSAGDRLPSEPRLAEELGVSRVSTRTALAQLESEGLISRRRGSGTYVNSVRPLVRSLHQNLGAEQLISSTGHVPGVSEMSWRQSGADEEVAQRLDLKVGEPVIHLYRVRTSDGTPVTVEHDFFPASLLPDQSFNLGSSLYSFLSTVCGIEISFGIADLEPALVGEERGAVLGVDSSELCMVIKQVDYDAAETPVSYSVEYHLACAFDFRLLRLGPGPKIRPVSNDRL